MGCIVEGETARLVIGEDGCRLAKCSLDFFAGLSNETSFLNNLIASVVESDNLRAMETDIADHVCCDANHQRHRR